MNLETAVTTRHQLEAAYNKLKSNADAPTTITVTIDHAEYRVKNIDHQTDRHGPTRIIVDLQNGDQLCFVRHCDGRFSGTTDYTVTLRTGPLHDREKKPFDNIIVRRVVEIPSKTPITSDNAVSLADMQ
ncbi:hypothetical protein [Halovenus sp. HT40]|uniref:hypothetical protein n=1 Tax=Halovenus sp. HT40 TaxID=3126691 RepID=UPI00300F5CB4